MDTQQLRLGELVIEVRRKDVKHLHLTVHPPTGEVAITAPERVNFNVIRAFVISKLAWIRSRGRSFREQERETPREFVERESHYLWGRRYLLNVEESDGRPGVWSERKWLTLRVRPGCDRAGCARLVHSWHKELLHEAIPPLISKWELVLGVKVRAYFLQRMRTRWGSCNSLLSHIRLNTELVKKPRELLEYVVVHEMLHLLEPIHSARFFDLLNRHYPLWREARQRLNELPLSGEGP